jgi:hypothetical protein
MSMWHVAMSMCMHISHMHICISHMCMPIRFIAFNHVHVHVHAHMCMHIKPYASVMIRACTYVRVHVHVHVHVHMHVHVHVHVHVYVLCMCMCMRCALHVHVHARGKVRKDSMLPHLGERLNVDSLPVIATHGVCLAVAPRQATSPASSAFFCHRSRVQRRSPFKVLCRLPELRRRARLRLPSATHPAQHVSPHHSGPLRPRVQVVWRLRRVPGGLEREKRISSPATGPL